ncbi:MAG: hypothetical protein V1853_02530 [bacterium]
MIKHLRIAQELPQFKDEPALLIVTGKQALQIYQAVNGEIKSILSYEMKMPNYSDLESFVSHSAGGIKRAKDSIVVQNFLKQLNGSVRDILSRTKISCTYLYSPNYMMNKVTAALPKSVRKTIKTTFSGNYKNFHPFHLLRMVQRSQLKFNWTI